MNLREDIRKILREESKIPPSVNRRLHYVDEYINNLDPDDVCEYWTVDEVNEYTSGTLSDIIRVMIGDSSGINSDNYGSVYDVIYEFLVNSNYDEQIRDFFLDSMDNCGIINESVPSQVRRRNEYFDIFFTGKRKNIKYCSFATPDHLINYLLELTLEDLYHALFADTVTYEEWEESIPYIENHIKDKYYDETRQMWESKCKGKLYESFTGDTPTDITKQFINKPVKLIGDVNTNTIIKNVKIDNNGSVSIKFQNGMSVNSSLPMLRSVDFGVSIPLEFKIRKKTIVLESEDKKGKYISALEDLTEDFKNEDCVCDIKIEYKPDEEIYLINVILGNLDIDDKFNGVNWRERDYRGKLKTKIRKEVFDYLPIPFFVEFKQTPRCKDYKNLQESETKKSRLLTNIEENGLYNVMGGSGLHVNQIEQMVGQLSREVLDGFIIDVLKEHGESLATESQTYVIDLDSWPLDPVPVGNNEYVERIRTTDNELLFTVMLYEEDEYGELEETSWEIIPSNALSYDNIYEIAGQLGYYLAKGKL